MTAKREKRPEVCAVCGKPLPKLNRAYCSPVCGRKARLERVKPETLLRDIARFHRQHLKPDERECLGCGEKFLSEGNWQRICRRCRERNDGVGGGEEVKVVLGDGKYVED